jgi:hypothetical protein
MKSNRYILLFAMLLGSLVFIQCDDDENGNVITQETCNDGIQNGDETGIDCGGSACVPCGQSLNFGGNYVQEDQAGRPEINTFFGTDGFRDQFNVTVPTEMQVNFQAMFETKLLDKINEGYTTNVLGLNATDFTTLMSKDVLWLGQTGQTTFYNGTTMTGRTLNEDVIDAMLLFMYGGPDGTENPDLTKDNVDTNDAALPTSFPYLAAPFE